ncbi:MAG: hypothetical protein ACHP65_05640 [Legionellales bacterium]
MKRFFMLFLSGFLPWVVLLMNDNPGGALVAVIMQATLIGWPFAAIWAWRVTKENLKNEKLAKPTKK